MLGATSRLVAIYTLPLQFLLQICLHLHYSLWSNALEPEILGQVLPKVECVILFNRFSLLFTCIFFIYLYFSATHKTYSVLRPVTHVYGLR